MKALKRCYKIFQKICKQSGFRTQYTHVWNHGSLYYIDPKSEVNGNNIFKVKTKIMKFGWRKKQWEGTVETEF